MVNYLEGANLCEINCNRLQTSARIILNDSDGTDSFGLFLYYIAYEEIAKGIFCLFVHKGYVSEDFITQVFSRHHPKIALFEEIFRSFEYKKGTVHLGGQPLGRIPLGDFIREHIEHIHEHRQVMMDFLYVGKEDQWKTPEVEVPDIQNREHMIKSKIGALNLIFEFVKNHIDRIDNQADGFQFYEDNEGNFTISYDVC